MTFQSIAFKSATGIHMNWGMVRCRVYACFILQLELDKMSSRFDLLSNLVPMVSLVMFVYVSIW